MTHHSPSSNNVNRRTLIASLLAYLMLTSQLTPMAMAFNSSAVRKAPPATLDIERKKTNEALPQRRGARSFAPVPVPLRVTALGTGPVISATKVDSFPDGDGDGKVSPGETITYSVTITNSGDAPATNVTLTDTVDPNTTIVPGSPDSTPIAFDDSYNVVGNVRIQPNAAEGVLANDNNPETGNNTDLTASGPTTGPTNGQATVNSDGSFSYNPNPGFTGTDTFTYTVTDATGETDIGTVTLIVGDGAGAGGNVIWFVNSAAAPGGDGRLTNPFNCLVGAGCYDPVAADEAGDTVFLYNGGYTGGLIFLANQKLVGQGASATLAALAGVTPPAYSDPLPATNANPASVVVTTTAATTNALNVSAGGILLRGFTVGNTTGAKIFGNNFATLTAGNNTMPDLVLNGTGQALNLTNGTFAATSAFVSVSTTSSGAQGISLATVAGTVGFGSTTVSGSTTQGILVGTSTANINFGPTAVGLAAAGSGGTDAISLQNNAAGLRTFGTVTIQNNSQVGFLHTVGGGATTSGATSITNPGGAGISIANSTTAVTFGNTSVTQSGGTGVSMSTNSGAVTFADLDISPDAGQRALQGTNNAGLITSTSGDVTATGNVTLEIVGLSVAARTPLAMVLNNLDSTNSSSIGVDLNFVSGTLTINDGTLATNISNPAGIGIRVQNSTALINFGNTNVSGSASTGVFLNANTGGIGFADLDITPDAGFRAFHATGNTGTLFSTSGTISTTTGVAVEITGAGTTPLNMSLTSVSVNGAPSGIVLQNTSASPGGFTVNGDGTNARNGSGGVINNTTDDGIRLTNANTVTLKSINLTSPGDTLQPLIADNEAPLGEHGVEANGGGNVVLSGVLIDGPAGSGMIALNLTGTNRLNLNSLVTNIDNPATHGLFIKNGSGFNMTLFEVNDTDFTNSSSGASTINATNEGTANMMVEIRNGCIFEALDSQAVTIAGGATAGTTGTLTSLVTGNTFQNGVVSSPGGTNVTSENNVAALVANGATHNATISNNLLQNIAEDGRVANTSIIRTQNSGGKLTAVVSGNTIQNINYQSGAGGRHVIGHVFEPPAFTPGNFSDLRFENNVATNITFTLTNREFIFIDYREFANGGDIKILNNNWNMPTDAATSEAVELRFRQANASTVDVQVDNNGQGGGAISATSTRFFRVDVEESATANLTITNNNFTNNSGAPGASIELRTEDNAAAGSGATACVNITGNNVTAAGNTIVFNEGIATTMTVTQASSAAVTAANNGAAVTVTGAVAFGGPVCTLPSNAAETAGISGSGTTSGFNHVELASRSKRDGGTAFRYAATDTSAPLVQTQTRTTQDKQTKGGGNKPEAPSTTGSASQQTGGPTKPAGQTSLPGGVVVDPGLRFIPKRKPATLPDATPPVIDGDTLTWNVGTLPAGGSVTITFQVVVDNPFMGAMPQVSNQGTVTADGGINVLTDDPDTGTPNDPTITGVTLPPDLFVRDASVAEPASGSTPMIFTLALSTPAPMGGITVTLSTEDITATGGTCAGDDYTTVTGGMVTFAAGEQIKTFPVTVCSDGNIEGDETFSLNVDSAPGAVIADGMGIGTITANVPGTIIISELRTSGPGGAGDDFVEIYNNTDTPHTVPAGGYGLFKRGVDCNALPVLVGTIPATTVIPAGGHYLFVGSTYSLANYGGTGAAAGDQTLVGDIESDFNVGLFSTIDPLQVSTANRLDAVGFGTSTGGVCDLLLEGTTLQPASGSTSEYSFVREFTLVGNSVPTPTDGNDNAADFTLVSTTPVTPVGSNALPKLGAPGPENLAGPNIKKFSEVGSFLLDQTQPTSGNPNRARDLTPVTNGANGTISFRRRFVNNTGGSITRLRFRLYDVTTSPVPSGTADLRALTSINVTINGVNDAATCAATGMPATPPCTVNAQGTTVEEPPAQPNGGGLNFSFSAGTVTLGTPLANGASINLQFLFGIQQGGSFRAFVFVEALP